MDDFGTKIANLARRHLTSDAALDLDSDLSAAGIGSLEMVGFLLDVEAAFEIEFPDGMIGSATFRTIRTVTEAVRRVQHERRVAP